MTTTDPRKFVGKTVRYNDSRRITTHRIVDFGEVMDEGEWRIALITSEGLVLDFYWGTDYSSDFTIVS